MPSHCSIGTFLILSVLLSRFRFSDAFVLKHIQADCSDHGLEQKSDETALVDESLGSERAMPKYSFYYLSRNSFYVPLYYQIYLVFYFVYLILRSIYTHKVSFSRGKVIWPHWSKT